MFDGAKDRDPLETIQISRNYLYEKGVFVSEEWHENGTSMYSVSLRIPGTGFSVNGKGISRKLALASAHGELQERILNKAFFRINTDTLYWMKRDCVCKLSDVGKILHENGLNEKEIIDTVNKCHKMHRYMGRIGEDTFVSLSGSKMAIPKYITDYLYGTNGMCAGNTFEEACTQGLSEIIERYVAKRIFAENIKCPDYDYKKLNNKSVNNFINRIAQWGIMTYVKDLSLGIGLPVIGVIFCNSNNHSYFMKIGAHPNLNIALERCFTEFVQGRKDADFGMMVDCKRIMDDEKNRLMNYFVDGNTAFPLCLLMNEGESQLVSIMVA